MNYPNIKRFNFTYAITGGAWIEDNTGYVNWEPFSVIERKMGKEWIDRQLKKQGWMTGCWVDCDNVNPLLYAPVIKTHNELATEGFTFDGEASCQ